MASATLHEDLNRHSTAQVGSARNFGFVFTGAFLILGLTPLRNGQGVRWWGLAISAAFLAIAFIRPALLDPLNRAWGKLGELLARIMNPVITTVLFFGVFTPFAVLLRVFGVELLPRRYQKDSSTYWVPRKEQVQATDPLSQQF